MAVEKVLDVCTGHKTRFSQHFIDLENRNIPTIGYGFPSYIFSVAEALTAHPEWYKHKEKVLPHVKDIMSRVALYGPPIISGVQETLETLSGKGFKLYVLTRGIDVEQISKFKKSGLDKYFEDVVVVPVKNKDTYLGVAEKFNFSARNLCMIGNSVKADVNPALEAGWAAIHVPAPTAWSHDEAEIIEHPRGHSVQRISDVPAYISRPQFWG